MVAPGGRLVFTYEPVLDGWSPQSRRVETNLGSNGLELTTFRWEPGDVTSGFGGMGDGAECAAGRLPA